MRLTTSGEESAASSGPADAEPVCRVEGLARSFGGLRAVDNVGFELRRGEILALLGPNGAGKTTTLSMLTGNLAPHAGRVRIAGHDLADAPRAAKRALGYLPEEPPLYPDMSVNAYLAWCARLHGLKRHALSRAIAAARERTGLGEVGKRLIAHLSKGYRQRVGIAQAILHGPALIVLDEPTSGLDPVQNREARQLIRGLAETAGVIFSTHQLSEVSAIAHRVAIMHRGRIAHETRLDGPLDRQAPRFRLELARPPAAVHLKRIAGIAAVETLAPDTFMIAAEPGADPRDALLRAAIAEDWGLLALTPRHPSLESLFLRIVHNEAGTNGPARNHAA